MLNTIKYKFLLTKNLKKNISIKYVFCSQFIEIIFIVLPLPKITLKISFNLIEIFYCNKRNLIEKQQNADINLFNVKIK